jgi:hypothetical protein
VGVLVVEQLQSPSFEQAEFRQTELIQLRPLGQLLSDRQLLLHVCTWLTANVTDEEQFSLALLKQLT